MKIHQIEDHANEDHANNEPRLAFPSANASSADKGFKGASHGSSQNHDWRSNEDTIRVWLINSSAFSCAREFVDRHPAAINDPADDRQFDQYREQTENDSEQSQREVEDRRDDYQRDDHENDCADCLSHNFVTPPKIELVISCNPVYATLKKYVSAKIRLVISPPFSCLPFSCLTLCQQENGRQENRPSHLLSFGRLK